MGPADVVVAWVPSGGAAVISDRSTGAGLVLNGVPPCPLFWRIITGNATRPTLQIIVHPPLFWDFARAHCQWRIEAGGYLI